MIPSATADMPSAVIKGRYPNKVTGLFEQNMLCQITAGPDHMTIRVDDKENPEVWIEITLPREDVEEAVAVANGFAEKEFLTGMGVIDKEEDHGGRGKDSTI